MNDAGEYGTDTRLWSAKYAERLRREAATAEQTRAALQTMSAEATSPDGHVLVRVGPSGATTEIALRPGTRTAEPEKLARLIMETTRQAQQKVGARVVEVMTELVGEDSPALDMVKRSLPEVGAARSAGVVDPQPIPELRPDTRPDDEYFTNPPEILPEINQ